MSTNKLTTLKKILIILIALLILILGGLSYIIITNNISFREIRYQITRNETDLIKICLENIESYNYDKKIYYFSKAVNIKDLKSVIKENKLFVDPDADNENEAEDTQSIIYTEYLFSYIYAQRYNEFHREFPKVYEFLKENSYYKYFPIWLGQTDKITNEGYKNIIKALEDNEPKIEVSIENYNQILHYQYNLAFRSIAFRNIGDDKNAIMIEKKIDKITDDLYNEAKLIAENKKITRLSRCKMNEDRFDDFSDIDDDDDFKEQFPLVDSLVELIRQNTPKDRIEIINPKRVEELNHTYKVMRDIVSESSPDAKFECVFSKIRDGSSVIRIETDELCVDRRTLKDFLSALSKADNFEIYPLIDGNIKIAIVFEGVLKSV